jgi:hypothetical protein
MTDLFDEMFTATDRWDELEPDLVDDEPVEDDEDDVLVPEDELVEASLPEGDDDFYDSEGNYLDY